jgi:hypothetical protein
MTLKPGDRVKLSADYRIAFPHSKHDRIGTVVRVMSRNVVRVKWGDLKSHDNLHVSYLELAE